MTAGQKWFLVIVAAILFIVIPALIIPEQLLMPSPETLEEHGEQIFAVLLTISLVLDIFLPVPSSVISTSAGAALGPLLGTIVSFTGMTLGCFLGYLIGRLANRYVLGNMMNARDLERAERLSMRFGIYFVLLARPVPVLAELCVFYAGATRMPFLPFAVIVSIANLMLSLLYAFVGDFTMNTGTFIIAALVAFSVPALGLAVASRLVGRTYLHNPSRSDPDF